MLPNLFVSAATKYAVAACEQSKHVVLEAFGFIQFLRLFHIPQVQGFIAPRGNDTLAFRIENGREDSITVADVRILEFAISRIEQPRGLVTAGGRQEA